MDVYIKVYLFRINTFPRNRNRPSSKTTTKIKYSYTIPTMTTVGTNGEYGNYFSIVIYNIFYTCQIII